MSILFILQTAGDVRADYANDQTEFWVGMMMVFAFVFLVVLLLRWHSADRNDVERRSRLRLAVVVLVIMLVGQAAFIAVYEPWYAKDPFEYYLPASNLSPERIRLEDGRNGDMDAIIFNGSFTFVYSYWDSDGCYLKVADRSDPGEKGIDMLIDQVWSVRSTRWDPLPIGDINLIEVDGSLQCYYSALSPDGIAGPETRMVSSTDGWNWSAPTVVDDVSLGIPVTDIDVPGKLSEFGWTRVGDSVAFDLGPDGFLMAVQYWDRGLDVEGFGGTYFTHSWDGEKWTDLVQLWPFYWEDEGYLNFKFHRIEEGSYLGICCPFDTAMLTEIEIDDFYEVDGPFYD
jgi:hypothetical protein